MDGAHATDIKPALSLKRRQRIETELRDIMASNGIRLGDVNRGSYSFGINEWTWSKLAEDLAERLAAAGLGSAT